MKDFKKPYFCKCWHSSLWSHPLPDLPGSPGIVCKRCGMDLLTFPLDWWRFMQQNKTPEPKPDPRALPHFQLILAAVSSSQLNHLSFSPFFLSAGGYLEAGAALALSKEGRYWTFHHLCLWLPCPSPAPSASSSCGAAAGSGRSSSWSAPAGKSSSFLHLPKSHISTQMHPKPAGLALRNVVWNLQGFCQFKCFQTHGETGTHWSYKSDFSSQWLVIGTKATINVLSNHGDWNKNPTINV